MIDSLLSFDLTLFDLEQTMNDMGSNRARIIVLNMLLYFTIGRLTMKKLEDEGMQKLHDMAGTAIKDLYNPSVPNSRFTSPIEAVARSAVEARSVGILKETCGYFPPDDKYFVEESQ